MRLALIRYWEQIRSGFWFLPSLMAVTAVVLSTATVSLDRAGVDRWLDARGWLYAGGAEGAAAVLGAVAGSMITIAGVVFSLTLVALSQASSQFGPRLLRNFMRDTANQIVLGAFVSTFLYCLLVLRTIRRGDEGIFVPHLSVTAGVFMAVASIGVLIYFIHHVSISIQADQVISRVHAELLHAIDRLYPEDVGLEPGETTETATEATAASSTSVVAVRAESDGYVQLIDSSTLLQVAVEKDLIVHVVKRPGDYAIRQSPLLHVGPRDNVDDDVKARLAKLFVLGDERTPPQDAKYLIDQLVEVALRALSPGVNDPFTALTCIDRLTSGLCRAAARAFPSPYRSDSDGRLRVVTPAATFAGLLSAAFAPIDEFGGESRLIVARLNQGLRAIVAACRNDSRRAEVEDLSRKLTFVERGKSPD